MRSTRSIYLFQGEPERARVFQFFFSEAYALYSLRLARRFSLAIEKNCSFLSINGLARACARAAACLPRGIMKEEGACFSIRATRGFIVRIYLTFPAIQRRRELDCQGGRVLITAVSRQIARAYMTERSLTMRSEVIGCAHN